MIHPPRSDRVNTFEVRFVVQGDYYEGCGHLLTLLENKALELTCWD